MSIVALYHCETANEILKVIKKIFHDLGNQKIINLLKNKKVLLKPNLCIDHPPEKGATTHPLVLEAIIKIIKKYNSKIIIGDGSTIGIKGNVAERTGIGKICKKYKIQFIDFNREKGKIIKLDDALVFKETQIAKTYFEVDTIINIPVLKSNMLYWVSGALKNMKGFLVGMEKHKPHYLGVAKAVADLNRMIKSDLIIMDGFIGMMGNGPAAGKPANAKLIMGGFDPVAIDTVAALLMGFNPKKIPIIKYSHEVQVGKMDFEIVGEPLKSFHLGFDRPAIAKNRIKARLLDFAGKYYFKNAGNKSKMVVDYNQCNLCLRCKEMCPFGAISLIEKKIIIDMSKCEYCLCCTEVCKKESIKLKGMLIGKEAFLK